MSLDDFLIGKLMVSGRGFDEDFFKAPTRELLLAVDFLHTRELLSESLKGIPH